MADVFISYAKRHAQLTEDLARDLEAEGYSTWWDTSLLPGDEFPEEIAREIDAAAAVIVIWTDASVDSPWVRAEANRAHARGKLITLHAEGLDPERVPLPFNTLQSSPVTDRAKVFAALARRGVRPSGEPVRGRWHELQGPKPQPDRAQAAIAEGRVDGVVAEEWGRVRKDDIDELRLFAQHFPGTYYGELAQKRIEEQVERERERDAWAKILHHLDQGGSGSQAMNDGVRLIEKYLEEFPNGKVASRARRILQTEKAMPLLVIFGVMFPLLLFVRDVPESLSRFWFAFYFVGGILLISAILSEVYIWREKLHIRRALALVPQEIRSD